MLDEKFQNLKEYLKTLESVAVAFSAGVDSTFLLKTAYDILHNKAIAVTVKFHSFPQRELEESIEFCKKQEIKHIIVDFDELKVEGFDKNTKERCYLCKKEILKKIIKIAQKNSVKNVVEGSNIDDISDYRPGFKAVKELGIKSPLQYAKLGKNEIRKLSKKLALPVWNKQSFACLASRFPYGEVITKEKLKMVDKAEQFLLDNGFEQMRVRIHNKMARIEVLEEDFSKILSMRKQILETFEKYGFIYVSLDLKGYRTGSCNEMLQAKF